MKAKVQPKAVSAVRPFLKWVGGKQNLLPQYDRLFPKVITNYFEPFLGGGAVFFHLQGRITGDIYLSDFNRSLIHAYRSVRDELPELMTRLDELQAKHSRDFYYAARKLYNLTHEPSYFIYLNKTCFNGLYRESEKSGFNVPVGSYKLPQIYCRQNLEAVSKVLTDKEVKFFALPFDDVLRQIVIDKEDIPDNNITDILSAATADKDSFVYLDPPYNDTFQGYTAKGFGVRQELILVEMCHELTAKNIKFALANTDNDFIREAFKAYNIHEVSASRNVSADGNSRGKIQELLITNYEVEL